MVQNEVLRRLTTVLDENNYFYQVLNKGIHVRVKDKNGIDWNFYTTTQKFHLNGQKSDSSGLKNFYDSIGIEESDAKSDILMVESDADYQSKSNKQIYFAKDTVIFPSFNLSYSIIGSYDVLSINYDDVEINIKAGSIFISNHPIIVKEIEPETNCISV